MSAPTQKVALPGLPIGAMVKLIGLVPVTVPMLAVPAVTVKLVSAPARPDGEPTLPILILIPFDLHGLTAQLIVTSARVVPVDRREPVPLCRATVPVLG